MISSNVRKVIRYAQIYGLRRALVKVAGRTQFEALRFAVLPMRRRRKDVGLIGCGQFGFATIGYFLQAEFGRCLRAVYDVDRSKSFFCARFYGADNVADSADELIRDPDISTIYIASDHVSHSGYAIAALAEGKTVYVEKPVSVSFQQLYDLSRAAKAHPGRLFAGYNRPYSHAISDLKAWLGGACGPATLNCFIFGHVLAATHWYREPQQGTRICGNMGHWLDLAVHLLSLTELVDRWRIRIAFSDVVSPDEDLTVSLTSKRGDLVTITLTARGEPFEGIRESICFQQDDVIAIIDDFRSMTIHRRSERKTMRFRPKDVGHRNAILQPFYPSYDPSLRWQEVFMSSLLMLTIADMVKCRQGDREFSFSKSGEQLPLLATLGEQLTNSV